MKRKIIIIGLALCLVFSVSVVSFASEKPTMPFVDTDKQYVIIRQHNGSDYYAYAFDSFHLENGSLMSHNADNYLYDGEKWVYRFTDNGNSSFGSHLIYVYDNTGTFSVSDLVTFLRPLEPIASKDILPFFEKLKGQFSVQFVVQVLVVGATAVVGIVFMWWGSRKLVRGVMSAFKKGKISL